MRKVSFQKADVEGFNIFYREAGPTGAQTLLLLHGFPRASHMFRDLVPGLADRFHVIAPDLPGFGQSDMPDRSAFTYTFHNIARVIDRFTEVESGSIALRSMCSTMGPRRGSGWRCGTRSASPPLSRRTEMPTRRG